VLIVNPRSVALVTALITMGVVMVAPAPPTTVRPERVQEAPG
jgi:hypothetical protein